MSRRSERMKEKKMSNKLHITHKSQLCHRKISSNKLYNMRSMASLENFGDYFGNSFSYYQNLQYNMLFVMRWNHQYHHYIYPYIVDVCIYFIIVLRLSCGRHSSSKMLYRKFIGHTLVIIAICLSS